MAKAYGIGKAESGAVASLMSKTPTAVVEKLQHATRRRGMFVTHDCIAKGLFELGFTSGIGAVSAWQQGLTNLDDLELVPWQKPSSNKIEIASRNILLSGLVRSTSSRSA